MAKLTSKITLGIDVGKDELVICNWTTQQITTINNDPQEIKAFFHAQAAPLRIAIEPTSTYHLDAVDIALTQDHEVYVINPRQLRHYRDAVNVRNKTDMVDAWLLARYLEHESEHLRLHQPQSRQAQQLWALIKRRGMLTGTRTKILQSLKGVGLSHRGFITELNRLIQRIDQRTKTLIRQLGWMAEYRFCDSIPGIGAVNATALVATYHRGAFASADAFVAYIGMDVRIRESGHYKGKRKLTKQGESEIRRLLYCASIPARSHARFARHHQRQLEKGLSKIAANNVVARKLARIAFSLMDNRQMFDKGIQMA